MDTVLAFEYSFTLDISLAVLTKINERTESGGRSGQNR
jgi:hypothetical protein